MKKTLFILMVVVGIITTIIAAPKKSTGTIQGTVLGADDKPLSEVSVQLKLEKAQVSTAKTNAKGFYKFSELQAGNYSLIFNKDGHTTGNKRITVKANQVSLCNVKLQRTPEYYAKKGQGIKGPSGSVQGSDHAYKIVGHDGTIAMAGSGGSVTASSNSGSFVRPDVAPGVYMSGDASRYATPGVPYGRKPPIQRNERYEQPNTQEYTSLKANSFRSAKQEPLSTFSIDVDTAFYSQMRSLLNNNQLPPENSIRTEELINYFDYNYPLPTGKHPFSVYTEVGVNPWNNRRNLVHIGLQGEKLLEEDAPPSNLVFLVDVSGSMNQANKLPLVQQSLKMLVDTLRPSDSIALAVYASNSGLVLPATDGADTRAIKDAIDNLRAGGSTAGGAGIRLAYSVAKENFIKGGNNRVILCTDGDFNVGVSSEADLVSMIEGYRKDGIFLTILGYGMGNYKDNKMEALSNAGNGNYAYIDNIQEAHKILVRQVMSTLYTIAKDVKIQVEFNPASVKAYRLIGYENRMLNTEDFVNDKVDAGEIGAGHTVTAIYEIIPANSKEKIPELVNLKYQSTGGNTSNTSEMMTVKLRYKKPNSDTSIPLEVIIPNRVLKEDETSETFRFANSVVGFSMLLQDSEHKGSLNWDTVLQIAKGSLGRDSDGWREEFLGLIRMAKTLKPDSSSSWPDESEEDDSLSLPENYRSCSVPTWFWGEWYTDIDNVWNVSVNGNTIRTGNVFYEILKAYYNGTRYMISTIQAKSREPHTFFVEPVNDNRMYINHTVGKAWRPKGKLDGHYKKR